MNRAVEAAVQAIYDRGDKLIEETIVEEARDPASPLHTHFEWDNEIAGHQYRLGQARRLIAMIRIEQHDRPPVQAWVKIPSTGSYEPTARAAADSDLRAEVLAKYRREVARLRERLRRFEEFTAVIAAIDDVLDDRAQ